MKKRFALTLLCCVFLMGTSAWSEIVDRRQETVPLGDADRVRLETAAGSLSVRGQTAGSAVQIDAEFDIDASSDRIQTILAQLDLSYEFRGRTLVITSRTDFDRDRPRTRRQDDFDPDRNENALIHLAITVPSNVDLEVSDGSGSTQIDNIMGQVDVNDGSGSLTISNVQSDLSIQDGSGRIEVKSVGGNLEITDGSGGIEIYDVGRSVQIDDSSGGIQVESVGGDVVVRDSSGGIKVRSVDGNFRVLQDSSGGIRHSNVKGSVELPPRR